MIENLVMGFGISLSFSNLMLCLFGCTLGTLVGVLPGLGPTATIAMLLPITYSLDLTGAIIMLSGIFYGCQYGGTITSVLLKIPGEASTVVTTLDGYAMALKGRAGKALGIAAIGSFFAGTVGTIAISLLSPALSEFSLGFGPPEFTVLMLLGLTLVVYLGGHSVLKAILMGAFGLALGVIGMDPVRGMVRYTFGSETLVEGLSLAIVAMGLFGIGEIFFMAESVGARSSRDTIKNPGAIRELLPNWRELKTCIMPISRGSILGFFLGVLPGGGATISTFASYALEKRLSRHPERFGKGVIEGVAAPESANNAAVSGAFIPLLTLGIPPNVVMALLLGAFMLHGVTPGPFVIKHHPEVFWGVVTSMYIGNVILLILNLPLIKIWVKILEIPFSLLSPLIVTVCSIGAYSINNNIIDVLMMMIFGVLGYLMRKFDYPPAPLMLAFVLEPILELSVRQSLIGSAGNPLIFFSSWICISLIGLVFLVILLPILMRALKRVH